MQMIWVITSHTESEQVTNVQPPSTANNIITIAPDSHQYICPGFPWLGGVQVKKSWFQPGTALKKIVISSGVSGTRYSCNIIIFLQCHNCDLAKWHHNLCRCTNSQHLACIVIFAGAPMVSVLHASWSLQEHQRPASCMHRDLCRSTNNQHPACIVIFAGAPSINALHASWSLQKHQQSAFWCIVIFAGAPTVSTLHASWSLQEHQHSVPCMHCDFCRSTNNKHSDASWSLQEHQQSVFWCIVIFAGAPTVSVLIHHDLCRCTNSQHPACIVIFSGAPMVSALHASWFFQEHQWSASCMHHDLCRSTNGQHPVCIVIFAGAPTVSVLHASWSLQEQMVSVLHASCHRRGTKDFKRA